MNPDKIYTEKYIELLRRFRTYNANEQDLICSHPVAGFRFNYDLLVIGREAPWWPERFTIHELAEKGEEYIYHSKSRIPGAYAVRKACPMAFVNDLWGGTDVRHLYNTLYQTNYDAFWRCVKEVTLGLKICPVKQEWYSYLSLTYLYKITYGNDRIIYEKPRGMQLDLCKELLKLEIYMGQPKRILFLTGMKWAKDFLELPEGIEMEDSVVSLGEYDYGVHRAETVVSVNPKRYNRGELVKTILLGFEKNEERKFESNEWEEYKEIEAVNFPRGKRIYCSRYKERGKVKR
jgi:hypothetical protein